MVQFNFNATDHDPSVGGGDVWEDGTYSVQITNSEFKETKAKTGWMLVLTLSAMDQGMSGRRLVVRLNVNNQNQQAVEIAMCELSAISHVCGVLNWSDTQQLHGKPFKVTVTKEARNDDPTKFNNNVVGYMDMNGNPPSAGGGQAPAAPAAPQAPVQQAAPQQQPAPAPQQQPAAQQAAPAPNPAPQQQPAPAANPAPGGGGSPSTPPWMQG